MKTFLALLYFIIIPVAGLTQVKKTTPLPVAGKDWLLWYKGKRQNDSVLITNAGVKITYKRTRQKVEVKNNKEPLRFQQMAAELNRSTQRKAEMIRRIAGDHPDPSDLPLIRAAIIKVDEVEKEYRDVLKMSIDIPENSLPLYTSIKKNNGPSWEEETAEKTWQEMLADIEAAVKALRNPNEVQLGVPPSLDVSICFTCDSMAKKRMDKEREDYLLPLKEEEQEIARNIFKLFHVFDVMDEQNKGVRAPEIQAAAETLLNDLRILNINVIKKVERLIALYKHDFLKMNSLMAFIISMDRQIQLMGLGDDLMANIHWDELLDGKDVKVYIDKLMAEQDYERILNYSWVFSVERHLALLGQPATANNLFDVIMSFNKFKLTVSVDAMQQDDESMIKGMLKSEVTYYKALPADDCKFIFVQSHDGKSYGVGQPFLKFKLLQAVQTKCTYKGPNDWVQIDPYIKIGFCSDDDSVRLFPLIPSLLKPQEEWQCEEATYYLVTVFSDAFENNNNMVDETPEMLDTLQQIQKFTQRLTTADAIAEDFTQLDHGYAIVKTIKEQFAQNALTIVPVKANNKSTIVFDKLYNGKLYTDNDRIVYANLWVKLEHVKN